jgi:glycosyltransferase involved in cell wall biosynthesis
LVKVTFVSWDGPGQTYLESLFLPIFARLRAYQFDVGVFQLTWAAPADIDTWANAAARHDVRFDAMRVPHRLLMLSAPASMLTAAARLAYLLRDGRTELLLARSIIPAGASLLARRAAPHARFVFDADGLPADERVDFANWSERAPPYVIWRDIEAHAVRVADAVVTRTAAAKHILHARAGSGTDSAKIFVVPNGKDAARFQPLDAAARRDVRERCGVPQTAPWLQFVGSVGPQYHLRECLEVVSRVLRRCPDVRMHILTGHESAARAHVAEAHLEKVVTVQRVAPDDVPGYLGAADLGFALRSATFSQRGVSPLKIAEYLLCGVPVLGLRGVGDLDTQLAGAGKLLDDVSSRELDEAATWIVDAVLPEREAFRTRCRAVGTEIFSIEECVDRYSEALRFALAACRATP